VVPGACGLSGGGDGLPVPSVHAIEVGRLDLVHGALNWPTELRVDT
jgi:hypothetical protein